MLSRQSALERPNRSNSTIQKSGLKNEIIFLVEESPEGGYEAKALGYSIFTQADTLEELKGMIRDALRAHFEDTERPKIVRLHIVRDEVIPA